MHVGLYRETLSQLQVYTLIQPTSVLSLSFASSIQPGAAELEGRQDHSVQLTPSRPLPHLFQSNSHGGHSPAFSRQPTPCPHCWLLVMFVLLVLLISNLNFLPLLLVCLLTMDLENKLYLLQQAIFSKITIRNNVDTMSSGCSNTLLSSRMEVLLPIPLLSESLVQNRSSFCLAVHDKQILE